MVLQRMGDVNCTITASDKDKKDIRQREGTVQNISYGQGPYMPWMQTPHSTAV